MALGLCGVAERVAAQTGSITGTVTNAATGAPLENAQIQAQQIGGLAYGAISAEGGTFRIINLADGVYTVTVRAIGYEQRVVFGSAARICRQRGAHRARNSAQPDSGYGQS